MDSVVVAEFGKGEPFNPIVLTFIDIDAKVLFNLLVYTLCLAISLRMESRGRRCLNAKEMIKFAHECGNKGRTTIADDLFREPMVTPDVVAEDFREAEGISFSVKRDCMHTFG